MGAARAVLLAAAVAVALAASAEPVTGLKPADPQPTAQQLAPGLAVQYTYAIVNHLDELKGRKFEPGPPLMHLEWKMGSGTVLTSKGREGVGATITGVVLFEKPGRYAFEVTSNDGVRLEVGGQLVHEDPVVHPDTTSDPIEVMVDRPGWYPIRIVYFQKRHTATLIVRWIPPGEPAKAVALPPRVLARPK